MKHIKCKECGQILAVFNKATETAESVGADDLDVSQAGGFFFIELHCPECDKRFVEVILQ